MTKTSFIHITDLHITSPKLDEDHVYSDTKKNGRITVNGIKPIKYKNVFHSALLISGIINNCLKFSKPTKIGGLKGNRFHS